MTTEELEDLCEGFKIQAELYFREWQAAKAQNEKLQVEVDSARQAISDFVRPHSAIEHKQAYENARSKLPPKLRNVAPGKYTPKGK